ncbi:MAG: O-antigen ligase family protein [Armatimonadota bacterium]
MLEPLEAIRVTRPRRRRWADRLAHTREVLSSRAKAWVPFAAAAVIAAVALTAGPAPSAPLVAMLAAATMALGRPSTGVALTCLVAAVGANAFLDLPGLPPLHVAEGMFLVLFAGTVARLALQRRLPGDRDPLVVPYLAFFGWCVVSVAVVQLTSSGVGLVGQLDGLVLYLLPLLAYTTVTNSITTEREVRMVGAACAASMVGQLAVQLWHLGQSGVIGVGVSSRVFGTLHGNFLGAYYIVCVAFALALAACEPRLVRRGAWLGAAALGLAGLVLAFSRASLVSAMIAAVVAARRVLARRLLPRWLLYGAVLSATIAAYGFVTRELGAGARLDEMSSARVPIAVDGIRIVGERPVFGIGLDDYGKYTHFKEWHHLRGRLAPINSAHNDYLAVAAGAGLPALGLYLWLLWRMGKSCRHLARSPGRFSAAIGTAAEAVFVAHLVENLASETVMGSFWNGEFAFLSARVYFWVMLAVVTASVKTLARQPTSVRHDSEVLGPREAAAR